MFDFTGDVQEPLALLETLLQHAPVGFAFVDRSFRFVRANDVLAASHSISAAEHIGKTVAEVVPQLWAAVEPLYQRALAGDAVLNQEVSGQTHTGEPRYWRVSYYPVRVRGEVVGLGVIVNDVTDPRRAEEALRDVARVSSQLAAIVESSRDAIIGQDLAGIITSWNRGAERIFGFTASEMLGTAGAALVPADRQAEEASMRARIAQGEGVELLETLRNTKHGRAIDVAITVSPIRTADGRIVGTSKIAHDITAVKEREREIRRLSRLYAGLSHVNQAIVCAPTRAALLVGVCQAIVQHGGLCMAWVGWLGADQHALVPVAQYGDATGYLNNIRITVDEEPAGFGPSGIAFRDGRPYICNDMFADPATLLWRDRIQRGGFRASAVFPIRHNGSVGGTLTVYADETGFFRDKEIGLLAEAAKDISFGLENLAREEERRHADLKLRREHDFSEAVLNSLPGVLYLYDQQGRFLRWNQNFERVSGYAAAEIAGMHPLDFFQGADQARVAARIGAVFEYGASDIEADLLSKDGRLTPFYFTGTTTQIGEQSCLVGVGIDISERKRAERERCASEARYLTLFEQAPDGILIADSEGRYIDANTSACRMLGYARHELLGLNGADIAVEAEVQHVAPALEAIKTTSNYHREWQFRRKDGSTFAAEVVATVMPDSKLLAMLRDVTQRKAAEHALRDLNETLELKVTTRTEELRAAVVRAETADRIKSAFLATMSHELRTPLNSIIGFTGIMLQGLAGPLNTEQSKQLGMVRSSARHLLALINDVLDLSKIEADQLEVRAESFDVRTSLEHVLATVKPLADKKGLALTAVLPPALSKLVSDQRRVEQILLNLLNNAIKFTERGAITLHAEIVGTSPQSVLRLRVADTGIGVKPEDLATLFRPFRQIDSGLTRQHEGTGLGLAICRRLAGLLGGEIGVTSEWAKGSEFTLSLPLERPTQA